MKTQSVDRDIVVFCVPADSFPQGVKAAWEKLHSLLPTTEGRNFYGLSRMENGQIVYKAAVEEAYPNEGLANRCERLTIQKGEYLAETLPDWRGHETKIGEIFQKLTADLRIDPDGWCLEKYIGEQEVLCMVKTRAASPAYEADQLGPEASKEQKIAPFLWMNGNVAEAIDFYTSVFKNAKVVSARRLPPEMAGGHEKVMSATFQIEGIEFMALDGGPQFKFTPAVSFFVKCKTQDEVDDLWEKLTSGGGQPGRCGWLTDRFGVSWQIIPDALAAALSDPDPAKARRALEAMMQMGKIEIAELERATEGE